MLDLAALFGTAGSVARQAITTAGTRVRFEARTTTTDPDTLEPVTVPTPLGEHPAIIAPAGNVNAAPELLPGVELRPGDWRVVCLPDVTPPPAQAVVVVVKSRDRHLPDREATVLGHVVSSAGAVLTVYARPRGVS